SRRRHARFSRDWSSDVCSADLLAPVDTNLYPGGWNHLTPEMLPLAVQAAMAAIEKICPEAKTLLLVPESTTDIFYLSNLAQLQRSEERRVRKEGRTGGASARHA